MKHAFFCKEPGSRSSSKSSLFLDLFLSISSLTVPKQFLNFHYTLNAIKVVQTQGNIKLRNCTFYFWLELKGKSTNKGGKKSINVSMRVLVVN